MKRCIRLAFGVVALLALLIPVSASAHERREVGTYKFVVGFLNEPAFQEEQNGLSVRITDKASENPVENVQDTLKAQVIFGDQQREVTLRPVWNDPGHYKSDFYPTAAGAYTFRFFGEIEGTAIDEAFTSSPDGFDEVKAPVDVQFPVQVPVVGSLNSELVAARNAARTATLLGGAGLAIGAISLIVAVLALRGRRVGASLRESSVARTST